MKNYKKDFPIFQKHPELVYLDSAATSQKPKIVLDAIVDYYENYNANVKRGIYPIAEKATAKVEEVRKTVAKFINAKSPEEIIFVRNATEAINLVAYAWGRKFAGKNDVITSTIMEHHSNFVPWQMLAKEKGAKFEVLDIKDEGELRIKNYELRDTKLLALTHVSNMLGTINPIKDIILRAKSETMSREVEKNSSRQSSNNKPLILVDAAQSVPHMKVDVQDLDCDFLVFSGHKMFASTGIGVLYAKKEILEQMNPFLFGGEMIREVRTDQTTFADVPHKFEAGTPDIAGIVSLGAAIDYLESVGMDNVKKHEHEHEHELIAYSLSLMEKVQGLKIYGPRDHKKRGGVISFTLDGIHPHDIAQILGDKNICIRAGHHCTMPLHKRLGIPASARISFSIYNTEKDIDMFVKEIKKIKKIFKK